MEQNKHQERIAMMEALYQYDFYKEDKQKLHETLEFTTFHDRFFELIDNYKVIDDIIESALTNYSLSRLSLVDRAILRLATFEMKFEDLPKEIAINEALILTKTYSNLDDNKQVKFNNKVLDTIAKVVFD